MTRYDEPPASDGHGGPHPLAGVPQEALDAATKALAEATFTQGPPPFQTLVLDADYNEPEPCAPIAHAVLMSGLAAMRAERLYRDPMDDAPEPEHVVVVDGYQPIELGRYYDGRLALTAWTRLGDGTTVVLDRGQVARLIADLAEFSREHFA